LFYLLAKFLEVTHRFQDLEVHTTGKDGDFIAVNHFTKEGGLFEFDSNDITENLIESRNELMNAYEGLFLSELLECLNFLIIFLKIPLNSS
jgi:hypothetical protein